MVYIPTSLPPVLRRPRPQTGDDFELDEVGLAHGSLRKMPFGQNGRWPAISAKGDKLAYVSLSSDRGDIWRKDLLHPEAAATRLLSSTRDQTAPQYSPDGAHIAFASNRGGSWEIWMSDSDGAHLVQMSDFKTSESGNPRWSPDSQKIAFDSRNSGHLSVFIVDISERMPREVSTNLSDISTPSWSHDGKWLYFQARTALSPTERIHRCLATGGDAVAVSADLGSYPSESYGGDAVYFADRLGSVRLHAASLKSLGTETVLKGIPEVAGRTRWTVAPGGIYFVSTAAPKSVHYFDLPLAQSVPSSMPRKNSAMDCLFLRTAAGSSLHRLTVGIATSCSSNTYSSSPGTRSFIQKNACAAIGWSHSISPWVVKRTRKNTASLSNTLFTSALAE